MPESYALPPASFFEAADRAADLEAEELVGDKTPEALYRLAPKKSALWTSMGAELEASGWPQGAIASKIAREIEARLFRRTGTKASVQTAYFHRIMAENRWQDPKRSEAAKKANAPRGGASKKPYISLGRDGANEEVADDPVPSSSSKPEPKMLNADLADALRAEAEALRRAAKTLQDRKWQGAIDLAAEHAAEYAEAVRAVKAATVILDEEGAKRSRVPATAHHLFRMLAGRGELSALKVSELFAAERLRLVKEAGDRIGKAIVQQYRSGRTAGPPPPILRPSGREGALLLGWTGQQCIACGHWRVEVLAAIPGRADRRCIDCGKEQHAVHPAVCPKCTALVYGPPVQHGKVQGRLAAECRACGHKIPLDKKTAMEVLAPEAR